MPRHNSSRAPAYGPVVLQAESKILFSQVKTMCSQSSELSAHCTEPTIVHPVSKASDPFPAALAFEAFNAADDGDSLFAPSA